METDAELREVERMKHLRRKCTFATMFIYTQVSECGKEVFISKGSLLYRCTALSIQCNTSLWSQDIDIYV